MFRGNKSKTRHVLFGFSRLHCWSNPVSDYDAVLFSTPITSISSPINHQLKLSYIHPTITCSAAMTSTTTAPKYVPRNAPPLKRAHQINSLLFSPLTISDGHHSMDLHLLTSLHPQPPMPVRCSHSSRSCQRSGRGHQGRHGGRDLDPRELPRPSRRSSHARAARARSQRLAPPMADAAGQARCSDGRRRAGGAQGIGAGTLEPGHSAAQGVRGQVASVE